MSVRSSFAGAVAAGFVILGCHTITELPSSPAPTPTPAPLTPIQIPITNMPTPAPTPGPTPNPAPNPNPTPTPTPTPGGGGVHVLCSPAIPPDNFPCPRSANPAFVGAVESAILKLKRDHPELFNDYFVLDRTAYYNGVFQNLYDTGYCAIKDSEEVAVSTRADRKYRENYQILTSSGKYWTGVKSHQSACQVP